MKNAFCYKVFYFISKENNEAFVISWLKLQAFLNKAFSKDIKTECNVALSLQSAIAFISLLDTFGRCIGVPNPKHSECDLI